MRAIYGLLDKIVDFIKNKLTVEKFESLEERSDQMTSQTSLVSLIVVIVSAGVLYSKFEDDKIATFAFAAVLGLTVVGYVSDKFLDGCKNISENSIIKVSISAYTDLGGLFFGMLTLLAFGAAAVSAMNEAFEPAAMSVIMGMFLYMTTWLIVNPALLGLRVEKSTSLAQEAISLLLIPSKVGLRAIKVLTAWLLTFGNMFIFIGAAMAFMKESNYEAMEALGLVGVGYSMVGAAMVLPLMGYFSYMFLSLIFDGLRNVLMISEINHKLNGSEEVAEEVAEEVVEEVAEEVAEEVVEENTGE